MWYVKELTLRVSPLSPPLSHSLYLTLMLQTAAFCDPSGCHSNPRESCKIISQAQDAGLNLV